jgi:hypothetical protein
MPSYSTTVDGYFDTAAAPWFGTGLWNSTGTEAAARTSFPMGMSFQLLSNFHAVLGMPLDPPGFSAMTLTLQVITTLNDGTFNLYAVDDPLPTVWSATNLPTTTGGIVVASVTTSLIGTYNIALNMTVVRPIITHPSWRGLLVLALSLDDTGAAGSFRTIHSNESATVASRPVLTTTEFAFNTGIGTHDIHRPGRIRTCPRTGIMAFADEFVEDGYIEGLWVHESAYDPPDETDRQVVPSSEGVVNDEVP